MVSSLVTWDTFKISFVKGYMKRRFLENHAEDACSYCVFCVFSLTTCQLNCVMALNVPSFYTDRQKVTHLF